MTTTAAGSLLLAPAASRLRSFTPTRAFLKPLSSISSSPLYRNLSAKIRASSATATMETTKGTDLNENEVNAKKQILGCPICHDMLIWNGDPVFSIDSTPRSTLKCSTCKKAYSGNETHLDLTITSGSNKYGEYMPASSELFRFPLVSFLYERGWRQSFSLWGGFPGPEREFELMKDYLTPVIGGSIIDASCGSGMFTRLFAKSGLFSLVVALDFSESMLKQCYNYIKQEESISQENLILVRADIARLPFASSSIDVVHAGAALHCWPSPSAGVTNSWRDPPTSDQIVLVLKVMVKWAFGQRFVCLVHQGFRGFQLTFPSGRDCLGHRLTQGVYMVFGQCFGKRDFYGTFVGAHIHVMFL